MRTFFPSGSEGLKHLETPALIDYPHKHLSDDSVALQGLVAVYGSVGSGPTIEKIGGRNPSSFIETLSSAVYSTARNLGGPIPYIAIREVVENLIHANFAEVVVSILDAGCTLRIADQGPGIDNKEKAVAPGYTTATKTMKQYIRGVGCGLSLAVDLLAQKQCRLQIDDNLTGGTVVTIYSSQPTAEVPLIKADSEPVLLSTPMDLGSKLSYDQKTVPKLSTRYKRVLSLVFEFGEVGPTLISRELSIGLSTAYRDLSSLEQAGLLTTKENGKRALTDLGLNYINHLFT